MMGKFINFNGEIFPIETPLMKGNNRGLTYGDALFETMRCKGTIAPFFDAHLARLKRGLEFLQMKPNSFITPKILRKNIERLINKERFFNGASVRVTVYRDAAGKYTPSADKIGITITADELPENEYLFNLKGLHVGVCTETFKSSHPVGNLKTTNCFPQILAGKYYKIKNLDESILLNEKGFVSEFVSSNLFYLQDKTLYTPSLSTGCLAGTMRDKIILLAPNLGLNVIESDEMLPEDLLKADELWLSNAVRGVQWVSALERKRFFYQSAKKMQEAINYEFLKSFR